jgi:poly(A) polymerase
VILPEVRQEGADDQVWSLELAALTALVEPEFALALAALLRGTLPGAGREVGLRLRLSNQETDRIAWLLEHDGLLRQARELPWPRLQRLLLEPGIGDLLAWHAAIAAAEGLDTGPLAYCREIMARPREVWDPPPLVGGDDLKRAGIPPGPRYRELLDQIRDAQLLGQIRTAEEALSLAALLGGG